MRSPSAASGLGLKDGGVYSDDISVSSLGSLNHEILWSGIEIGKDGTATAIERDEGIRISSSHPRPVEGRDICFFPI